jgi:hypothetical protein
MRKLVPEVRVSNEQEFEVQLSQFGELTEDRLRQFAQRFCSRLTEEIVRTTPVDTGYLRASWKPSIDASAVGVGDVWELANTAKYARRVEFGFIGKDSLGRTYNQAGCGFVRAALGKADQIAAEVLVGLS